GDLTAARRQTADEDGFTFGIACGGDRVTLLDPTGAAADAVDVPLQPAAYTWGRLPDGAGDWQRTDPTRDAPNAAPVDAAAALFDPAAVFEIDLSLRPEALEALAREPREYVPATLRVDGGDPLEVGVHLKGRLGSFRELDAKAAFKVKINAYDGDLRLRGLKKLTLNNMVQDPSKLHEWTAYTLFRAMGVPAPRVGYAWVRLNGEGYGLYAHVETIDDVMLDRWLPSTGSLYEGAYGQDLFLRDIASLDRDEGDGDRAPLRALVDLLDDHAPADAYAATADRIDWPQVVALMVTEIYIGHWDGYAPTQNNFFLHFDDDDVLRLLPWGTDQTFDRHLEIHAGRGRLLQICLAAADCRRLFDETLGHLLDVVDALDLPPAIEAVRARLAPFAAADPRNRHDAESVADAVRRTQRFLADRRRDLAPLVECLLSPNPDPDGDGFICDADCDPNDGTIFPGAEDLCGDGIDQDCNGYVDDDDACPDCAELFRGGQRYLVCTTPRTWEAQQARCAEHGAELARPDDPAEAAWLYAQAIALRDQDYWLGLNDRDAEGVYVWADGAPLGAANWNDGEPNNAGNEDCVHLWARNGQWNDLPCEARLGGLCEAPCDPSRVDADGDGVHGCGEDCDDGDPGVGRCDE
ncbi:MAG: CotH kinase family protein, partial [Myxococcales bacterium]|nr:CotH kinase family protein [Myxococcales bacterium]